VITQGAFNHLFRAGLRKDFRDNFDMYEPEYPMYLKQSRMDGPEIEASIITGLKRLIERGDGEEVTFEDPKLGPKVVGIDKEYALGFMITRKTVEDDKYGKANQAAKWLAHATRMTYEYRSAAMLDDAFSGTTFKGIDGLRLCHTAHTLINSSSTVSNQVSPAVGFSVTGITALLDLHQLMKDENGDPIKSMPDTVIYNPTQISKALQIFGSALEPFTADNQTNAVKQRLPNIKHVVKRYTTDTNDFFMVDSKLNDAHFVTRRAVTFDDDFDFKTDAAMYKASTRFLVWFVDWRGWAGSNPT
jgi:hypothetical protein